ncbi:MAG: hypothetical protein PHP74_01040 [Candidatus Gracilibacteria bacterium]|nr:hypothetical protein [Candidatus Gracilibacteria bacterium]
MSGDFVISPWIKYSELFFEPFVGSPHDHVYFVEDEVFIGVRE